jgi:hypothetical protein
MKDERAAPKKGEENNGLWMSWVEGGGKIQLDLHQHDRTKPSKGVVRLIQGYVPSSDSRVHLTQIEKCGVVLQLGQPLSR